MEKTVIDLEDLRGEYESTYLAYGQNQNPISFDKWLKKEKGIVLTKQQKKKYL